MRASNNDGQDDRGIARRSSRFPICISTVWTRLEAGSVKKLSESQIQAIIGSVSLSWTQQLPSIQDAATSLRHEQKVKQRGILQMKTDIDTSGFEALKIAMRQTAETLKSVAAGYAELTKKR